MQKPAKTEATTTQQQKKKDKGKSDPIRDGIGGTAAAIGELPYVVAPRIAAVVVLQRRPILIDHYIHGYVSCVHIW